MVSSVEQLSLFKVFRNIHISKQNNNNLNLIFFRDRGLFRGHGFQAGGNQKGHHGHPGGCKDSRPPSEDSYGSCDERLRRQE